MSKTDVDKERFPYFDNISSKAAIEQAQREGKVIVLPDSHTLQIDIDTKESYELMKQRLRNLDQWGYYPYIEKDEPSPSGRAWHRHVYIKVDTQLTMLERIILQMYLGSDMTREFLSLIRYKTGDKYPTKFFEVRPDENI